MNRTVKSIFLLCGFIMFAHSVFAQSSKTPIPLNKLLNSIENKVVETQKIYNWEEASDYMLWSALTYTDSLAAIGYRPKGQLNTSGSNDTNNKEWTAARTEIKQMIMDHVHSKYGNKYTEDYIFPDKAVNQLAFFKIRVLDDELVAELREMENILFIEVYDFDYNDLRLLKSAEGCSNYSAPVNAIDYTVISPMSRESWHHAEHNIACAWMNGNQGAGKTIAVFDTGISAANPKFNAEFTEGDSGGRTILKKGFYDPAGGTAYDGVDDDCGHGTAMAGLSTAPRGFNDTPAGVAYKANLVSYRGTADVIIGSANEKNGVIAAFNDVAADASIDIVSMSLGDIFYSGTVHMAIRNAQNNGKLIFCAAGTSFPIINTFTGVIFPADQAETVAVTGVIEGSNYTQCGVCHDGSEVDFVVSMERPSGKKALTITNDNTANNYYQGYIGGSSAATATMAGIAALAWANNPSLNNGQILNRLIRSTSNHPSRDGSFGWGRVDACAAIVNDFAMPCTESLSNDVHIEITKITFPIDDDGIGGENEWVIELNGHTYYFDVDDDGVMGGYPDHHMNMNCEYLIPLEIDFGTSACGQTDFDVMVQSHEDDGLTNSCTSDGCSGFFDVDDFCTSVETYTISYTDNTFTHSFDGLDIIFEFDWYCTPVSTSPDASFTSTDAVVCVGDPAVDIEITATGDSPEYMITYNIDGGLDQTISSTLSIVTLSQSTASAGTYVYNLVSIQDMNSCSTPITGSVTITVSDVPVITLTDDGPGCEGQDLTFTATAGYSNYEFFIDVNANSAIDPGESLLSSASNIYTISTLSTGDAFSVVVTNANNCSSVIIDPPIINPVPMTPDAPVVSGCDVTLTPKSGTDVMAVASPDNATGGADAANFNATTGVYSAQAGNTAGSIDIAISNANCTIIYTLTTPFCPATVPVISISDPCMCNNDAATSDPHSFSEIVTVVGPTGANWTVATIVGGDAAVNAVLTETPTGSGNYEITFSHPDGVGYLMSVTDGTDILWVTNICQYPTASITLATQYCIEDDMAYDFSTLVMENSSPLQAGMIQNIRIDGIPVANLNPSTLSLGTHTLTGEYLGSGNGGDGTNAGNATDSYEGVDLNPTPQATMPVASACYDVYMGSFDIIECCLADNGTLSISKK